MQLGTAHTNSSYPVFRNKGSGYYVVPVLEKTSAMAPWLAALDSQAQGRGVSVHRVALDSPPARFPVSPSSPLAFLLPEL